uniref:Putative craniofacial development protein 2-like n=1 Tax=Solanum chacoense TaxID=4108 RepID=A0A0V0GRP8_SOLCH
MIKGMPRMGKLFERGDFNRHIGSTPRSYDNVQGGFRFSFRDRNVGGVALLNFAKAFGLVVDKSSFTKEEHLVTFHSAVAKNKKDYLL